MTEDEAQAWLQFRQIRHVWKPSDYADDPRWRCHLMRPTEKGLRVYVPNKSVAAVLRFIAVEAWAEYPTRKESKLAEKLWRFFSQEEMRELAQQDWSAE
jgi:hypothetical protein